MEQDKRAKEILADFDAFPEFGKWQSFAEDIAIYAEERKAGVLGGRTAGQIDSTRIFDTTFREALETASAGTVSNLTPQNEAWLDLESQSFGPSEEEKAAWNEIGGRVRTRIGQSNFYRGFHEGVHSGMLFGTFCLDMYPGKKKPFNFREVMFGNFRFREDGEGVPDIVFHEWQPRTAAQIADAFSEEIKAGKASLSEKMEECLNSDSADKRNEKFTIIHRVMPRKGAAKGIAPPSKRPYESVYVVKECNHTLMDNDGYYYQRYIVCRMLKSRHDMDMGRSPGTQIYPTVRMINRAVRDVGVAIEKTVNPAILEPNDSEFEYDTRPGGRIPFDPFNPNSKPEPFNENPNIQNADYFINRLEQQIKGALFNSLFKFFTEQSIATTEKTAFEVQLQAEEQLQLFTPIFLNIVDECLNRVIENVFKEMFIKGDFNDIEGIGELGNFSVVYTSRLALAVRQQKTNALARLANLGQIIDAYAPGAAARAIDWSGAFAQAARDSVVDAEFVNDKNTISQLEERDQKIQELMQMLEAAQMAGQAYSQFTANGKQ